MNSTALLKLTYNSRQTKVVRSSQVCSISFSSVRWVSEQNVFSLHLQCKNRKAIAMQCNAIAMNPVHSKFQFQFLRRNEKRSEPVQLMNDINRKAVFDFWLDVRWDDTHVLSLTQASQVKKKKQSQPRSVINKQGSEAEVRGIF